MAENLLYQHCDDRDRGNQEGLTTFGQQRDRTHRDDQQDAKAARDATTRVEQQADRHRIDEGVAREQHPAGDARQALRQHQRNTGEEIQQADRDEEPRMIAADRRLRQRKAVYRKEHRRHEQPVEVQQPDDPPAEIAQGRVAVVVVSPHLPRL